MADNNQQIKTKSKYVHKASKKHKILKHHNIKLTKVYSEDIKKINKNSFLNIDKIVNKEKEIEEHGIEDTDESIPRIELVDMIPYYPKISDKNFQGIISSKNEFIKYSSDLNEKNPKRGEYYNHQNFLFTHAKQFENVIIIDEPGSGKSCQIFQYTEYARTQYNLFKEGKDSDWKNSHFKGCIIICKNEAQLKQLQGQLICNCTKKGTYDLPKYSYEKRERQEKLILNDIYKFYQFKTQDSLWKDLKKKFAVIPDESFSELDEDRVASAYSDYIFWIDEAHNINPSIETKSKDAKQLENIYQRFWELFHYAKRIKVFLTTGTPMINEPREIIKVMNLILPINLQMPINIDLGTNTTLEDLEPYFRGRVSFIRGAIANAETKYITNYEDQLSEEDIDTKHYKLFCVEMSDFQKQAYHKAEDLNFTSFSSAYQQISNFVYPDGSWGRGLLSERQRLEQRRYTEQLFDKNIGGEITYETIENDLDDLQDDGTYEVNSGEPKYVINELSNGFRATSEFKKYLSNRENIKKSSVKFYNALQIIEDNIDNNFFIYCKYVNGGSGIRTFALCLESYGFERFNEYNSIFQTKNKTVKNLDYCHEKKEEEDEEEGGKGKINIKSHSEGAKWRYAILDGNTDEKQLMTILEAMNSYENRYGEYIKVIIASPKIKEAINLKNITIGILLSAEWNHSTIFQIVSRFLRATGFEHLLKDRGAISGNIIANIYMMASYYINKNNQIISRDIDMFKTAERKNIEISNIMRIMKQCAIGCHLHRKRNVRSEDKDFSPDCDYAECNYPCSTTKIDTVDYSSYDILYSDEDIENCIIQISKIFQLNNCLSFNGILQRLNFRPNIVIFALERMITMRRHIFDRYGFPTFLTEDNGYFFLMRNYFYGIKNPLCMAFYSNGLIGIKQNSIEDIKKNSEIVIYNNFINKIKKLQTDDEKIEYFNSIVKSFSGNIKSMIIEETLLDYILEKYNLGEKFDEYIIETFKGYIFDEIEQADELAETIEMKKNKKVKQGRKVKKDAKRKIKKLKDINPEGIQTEGERIILNIMGIIPDTQTNYSIASKYSKAEGIVRLLKPNDPNPKWRDLHENEFKVYNKILQANIKKKLDEYDELGIYGILQQNSFKIKVVEDKDADTKKDARYENRGKTCTNWTKHELIDIMYTLNYDIFSHFPEMRNLEIPTKDVMFQTIIKYNPSLSYTNLIDWDEKKIIYYYAFIKSVIERLNIFSVKNICTIIQDYFKEIGHLVEF